MIKSLKELKSTLEELIESSDIVFITPHLGPDCDAIASAIGMSMIVKKLDKTPFIVIDNGTFKIEQAVKTIVDELPDTIKIVNSEKANRIREGMKCLLIMVDTNKSNLIPFENVKNFSDVVIIDHHEKGETTVSTDYTYIDTKVSSASEILFNLLSLFSVKLDFRLDVDNLEDPINIANYLLSGINLDTSKFTKNVSQTTMEVVAKLMKKGADMNYVNELFMDDFENDMRVQNLVSKTEWKLFNIAIAINNDDPDMIYSKEDLAKAADWLLKYKATDASFSLGYIEPSVVYISARSRGDVDVGEIMAQMSGGGSEYGAAARIDDANINDVKLMLEKVIRPGYKLK